MNGVAYERPMSSKTFSERLSEVYDTLPLEAQRTLVETHILPLIDLLPKEPAENLIYVATDYQSRIRPMPKLDLKGKKKEVNGLLDALNRDLKVNFTRERSSREELLLEVVDSLASWLNDIWSTVYEYRDNYLLAHTCLLFTADVSSSLMQTSSADDPCKCPLSNAPIDITIRKKNGEIVHSFALHGLQNLGQAILWIWRELFVSLSAYGTPSAKQKLPEMIVELESIIGWRALERLLQGGRASIVSNSDGDNDYDESEEEDGCMPYLEDLDEQYIDEDDDPDYVDEDGDDAWEDETPAIYQATCSWHANHWSDTIHKQKTPLRQLVEDRLHKIFRLMPSLDLYNTIRSISIDAREADRTLLQETNENATKSSDTFAGALSIFCSKGNGQKIFSLLNTHHHLLRPKDILIFQRAVGILTQSGYISRGMQILEQELFESIRAIHMAVNSAFGYMDLEEHKNTLESILKSTFGSRDRKDRIEQWVDSIVTASPINFVTFAAMMMGLPVGVAAEDGGLDHLVTLLDEADPSDPDWEELREEYRPKLQERFDGWYKLTSPFKDPATQTILANTYIKTVHLMPFLRGVDIVEHMVLRLTQLQGKNHVARALQAVSNFCIFQRKKFTMAANKNRRTNERAPVLGTVNTPFPFSFHAPPPTPPSFGGMEDVD